MNNAKNFQIYNASAGSGKTFTLVAEYLKILFKSDSLYSFQQILAITFTNKAAAEMKVRILDNLQEFSTIKIPTSNNLFNKICEEIDLEPNEIKLKSAQIIKNILNNYGAFNITTIDSFTYKLIKSFAFDLGIALNFEVEMDAISLLNESVDVLISRIGEDESLTKTLIDFSISKANEDKSWDIAIDLKEIAKLLLNENDVLQVTKIKKKNIHDFINLQKTINNQLQESIKQFTLIGEKGLQLIADLQISDNDFFRSQFPKYFKKLATNVDSIKFEKNSSLSRNIENEIFYAKSKPQAIKSAIDTIIPTLVSYFNESEKIFENYLLNKLISKSLIPLAILRAINNVLSEIKEDNNTRLISEFNQLISNHLKEQPAAFIYEKIGERFRHYFIDEMQDTSVMQWENLVPLLDNVLSSENDKGTYGTLLLVGDAKQAIYRWRGGKAEQFISLSSKNGVNPFFIKKNINQLETNWRSYSEIINFNNTFFQHISKYLKNDSYRELYTIGNKQKENTKKGGYVEIQFIDEGLKADEKFVVYPEKVLEIIQNLTPKFKQKEICVLTRTRKQGVAIAEFLTKHEIAVISSETLLLQNSSKVQFIINLLQFINQPFDKEIQFEVIYFLHQHLKITQEKNLFLQDVLALDILAFFNIWQKQNIFFDYAYFTSLSLYEGVEYIIRNFKLTESSDAYLQFFLDVILNFSLKKSIGIDGFLQFWEEKKDSLSIVVSSERDAVNIMTIHKSKGLEFPVVIYPFDLDIYKQLNPKVWYEPLDKEKYANFDSALVNYNKTLKEVGKIGEQLYNSQREELELDNFNLLYVALTRAEEQLYIISEHKKDFDEPKTYAQFFIDFLKHKGLWNRNNSVFSFGDSKRISELTPSKINNIIQKTFISSDWRQHNIHIVPTINEDINNDARAYGNLIHELLAHIITIEDVDQVIQTYSLNGKIKFEDKDIISQLILKVLLHKELSDYYTNKYQVLNEREIITYDGSIIIPDRIVIKGRNAIIIDYKTGKAEKKHHKQVTIYADALEKMNYTVTKKLLVYIDDEVRVITVK